MFFRDEQLRRCGVGGKDDVVDVVNGGCAAMSQDHPMLRKGRPPEATTPQQQLRPIDRSTSLPEGCLVRKRTVSLRQRSASFRYEEDDETKADGAAADGRGTTDSANYSGKKRSRRKSSAAAAAAAAAPPLLFPGLGSGRALCLLALLTAAATAVITFLLTDYVSSLRDAVEATNNTAHIPLPSDHYIALIEEKHALHDLTQRAATQLQQQRSSAVQESSSGSGGDADAEALKSLDMAVILKKNKRVEKALKVFKHALALSPRHPRILNFYGEFLEETSDDVVEADRMFVRAIAFSQLDSEDRERALANRARTSARVEDMDWAQLQRLAEKKRSFQRISDNSAAMRRAKKEAYFQHIYHTVGIEGNTMTLSQTRSILETKLAVGGKSIIEHNEILGMDAALRYINGSLVDRVGAITMRDLLEIHRRVVGFVDPIEAGLFRQTQVYVGDHVPPHPSHIDSLMERFICWLNDAENFALHPVRFAALAHYKLVYIHPFTDGNGRTSRLLMNLILMQSGYPPVIIRKQDRLEYYKHLETANEGDIRPFIRFIAECAERTLDAYIWSTTAYNIQPFDSDAVAAADDDVIATLQHFDAQDKIIMGGKVGENVTVEP